MTAWPPMPPQGTVIADIDTLKLYVGARSNQDDALLSDRLVVAREYVYTRVKEARWGDNDCQEAVLLLASRLYKRRQSPEGVAGFGAEGGLVRIVAGDPDLNALMERLLDLTDAGIA